MQRLADTLVSSLRKSVLTSISELEKFLDEYLYNLYYYLFPFFLYLDNFLIFFL